MRARIPFGWAVPDRRVEPAEADWERLLALDPEASLLPRAGNAVRHSDAVAMARGSRWHGSGHPTFAGGHRLGVDGALHPVLQQHGVETSARRTDQGLTSETWFPG